MKPRIATDDMAAPVDVESAKRLPVRPVKSSKDYGPK